MRLVDQDLDWIVRPGYLVRAVQPRGAWPCEGRRLGNHEPGGGHVQPVRERQFGVGVHAAQESAPAG